MVYAVGLLVILIGRVIWLGVKNGGSRGSEISGGSDQSRVERIVCPRGLSYSVCPNPEAVHGRIMIHNNTSRGYTVEVEHHGINQMETYHIQPGDGWTFTGVLQGKRMIIARATVGNRTFESHCVVIGGTMHTMNITSDGFQLAKSSDHYGHQEDEQSESDVIRLPKRKNIN